MQKWYRRRWQAAACVTCYIAVYLVWDAVAIACDQLPSLRGVECAPAYGDYTLVSVCIHNCSSIASNCRSVARWRAAGWAGAAKIVTDHPRHAGVEHASQLPDCEPLLRRPPGAPPLALEAFAPSDRLFLWCDKIRIIRAAGPLSLYADTDLVPSRCVGELSAPEYVSLFADAWCYGCNRYNAGLVWRDQSTHPDVPAFLEQWEATCRSDGAARVASKPNPSSPFPAGLAVPDDQVALDIVIDSGKFPLLPTQLPYDEVRYMNANLWRWWIPNAILWHYTSRVRQHCGIRP
ncbi:hypothetical protein DIPPA_19848 [Diplonema papillatum]|nr:hypothetical protein DIPPA_19848 [Diplonema papillatum]